MGAPDPVCRVRRGTDLGLTAFPAIAVSRLWEVSVVRSEIVELRRAIEKARTVAWANEPACTLPDVAVALVEAGSVLDAVTVDAVAALDASKEHKATGDFSPADLLRRRCRARHESMTRLQKAARRLRTMPHTQAAFTAGDISLDHVDVLIRANTAKLAERFARDEELLLGYARTRTFQGFRTEVQRWTAIVMPEDAEERAARQDDERTLHLSESFEGQGKLDAWLSRQGYHEVHAELDRHYQRLLREDWAEARARLGDAATALDLGRTPGQRRHDALIEMSRASKAHAGIAPAPDLGTTIVCDHDTFVTAFARIVAKIAGTDPDRFPYPLQRRCEWANGDPATPEQAVWAALTGWLDVLTLGPDGVPLDHGRRHRIATPAQRRAAKLAFPTCDQPGCDTRSDHCEIDHVLAWIDGGRTDIDNLRPRCKGHNLWKEWARRQRRRRRTGP